MKEAQRALQVLGEYLKKDGQAEFEEVYAILEKETGIARRELMMLLRIAMTGRRSGPPLKRRFSACNNAGSTGKDSMSTEKLRKLKKRIKNIFRSLSLRTQLLLILLFLLLASIGSLTVIYSRTEEMLIEKVTDNIEDITKAIQISVEELTYRGDSTQRLKTYVETLNKKGIREVSILSDASEVIASSNPKKIGTVEQPPKKTVTLEKPGRKTDLMITARLGRKQAGRKDNASTA